MRSNNHELHATLSKVGATEQLMVCTARDCRVVLPLSQAIFHAVSNQFEVREKNEQPALRR
jgi:hypothetical protein